VPQRFLASNLVTLSTTSLGASSEDVGHPLVWLRDQAPGKPWRSRAGWTFAANFNVTGTVRRGGTNYLFTIAAGYYATGDEVATAVTAALEAADATPVWGCTHTSGIGFTITSNLPVELLCETDARSSLVIHPWIELGFGRRDRAAATSHVANYVTYQSQHYVTVTLAAATAISGYALAWAVLAGTVRWAYSTASSVAAIKAARVAPFLTGNATVRSREVETGNDAPLYHAFVIDDTENQSAYSEIPNLFLGPYVAPTYSWTFTGYQREPQDLSGVEMAVSGAHVRTSRPVRKVWTVDWDALSEADMDVLRALKTTCPRGKNLWIVFDPADLTDVEYVTMDTGPNERLLSPTLYGPAATFAQVLP
jgi:hypothetical protein